MFIAMNRFRVIAGSEAEFEKVWTGRETHLRAVPGFVEFHLLRGPAREDHLLYASHTIWRSRGDFEAWTRSEEFRLAHQGAGSRKPLYLGHPEFEGFEIIQTVTPEPEWLVRILRAVVAEPVEAETAEIGFEILSARIGPAAPRAAIEAAIADGLRRGLLHDPVRLPQGALQCHWLLEPTARGRALVPGIHG